MSQEPDPTVEAARNVAATLHQRGHVEAAASVRKLLKGGHVGTVLLRALRDTLQVALTAIEAIDPVSGTMVEELRVEVNARLAERPDQPAAVQHPKAD